MMHQKENHVTLDQVVWRLVVLREEGAMWFIIAQLVREPKKPLRASRKEKGSYYGGVSASSQPI